MQNVYSVSSQQRNAWIIKNTGTFVKIQIGHQVSYTWWSFRKQVEIVSSPERFRDKQQWVHIVWCVYEQGRLAEEGKRTSSADLSRLQRVLSSPGSCRRLTASCQSVARKQPADPAVAPSAGSLFPLWCRGLLRDAAFISPSCQSRFTPTLLLLLIITIIIVWWQRCAEYLGRLWCWFPSRGGAVQFSTLMWHSGIQKWSGIIKNISSHGLKCILTTPSSSWQLHYFQKLLFIPVIFKLTMFLFVCSNHYILFFC